MKLEDLPPGLRDQAERQLQGAPARAFVSGTPKSPEELAALEKMVTAAVDQFRRDGEVTKKVRRRHGNVPTEDSTGRVHPSKLQARVTDRLRLANRAVMPEVSIPLSHRPKDRIRVDCLVIEEVLEDGVRFVGWFGDPKGHLTDAWQQKMRRFEDLYGVKILLIKKKEGK